MSGQRDESKQIRLYRKLKRDILNGTLQPGDRLPSRRRMAQEYGVSPITVEYAYAMLTEEELIETHPRSGCFVCFRAGEREGEEMNRELLAFSSDYMKGAHPAVLQRLSESNMEATAGYGLDPYSEAAKEKIRKACACPDARVEFLVGGTQTNATMIDALLRSYQGVIAADTGHISVHESGAIEASGHKVITLPATNGKIEASAVRDLLARFYRDETWEHMVMPGMVYLSQPTEYGTLYSKAELEAFRKVCDDYRIPLYLDGARLAYALACPENDVTLPDLAALCDAFYIGGTKCGLLFGEAVVLPDKERIPGFFTIIKQHGALLAKGRLLGLQFDTLFTDDLYQRIGEGAIRAADNIRNALKDKGYRLCFDSPTNQVFCIMENKKLEKLAEKVAYGFWEIFDDTHTIIRFATDWGTTQEETDALIAVL